MRRARCARLNAGIAATLLAAAWAFGALASPWPSADWPRSKPEAQGVDSAALAGLFEELADSGRRLDCVLLIRHAHVVAEVYVAPFEAGLVHDLRSVTKTVLGTLVGVAVQRGDLRSTELPVLTFFPDHRITDTRQRQITIDHLLDMRSGMEWREWPYDKRSDLMRMAASADWVRYILTRPMHQAPGKTFHYAGAAPHLLSAILTRATGLDAAHFARSSLFEPLGIMDVRWLTDPQGHATGDSGLSLRPLDLARIGLLILRDGWWRDRRLLPEGWADALFRQAPLHTLGTGRGLPPQYRRLWWIDERLPMAVASGRYGQHLVVLPRHDALLVINGRSSDAEASALRITEVVQRHLLQALRGDRPLPSNPQAHAILERQLTRMARPTALHGVRSPVTATQISGRRYAFGPNTQGIAALMIHFDPRERGRLVMWWRAPSAPGGEVAFERPFGSDGRYLKSDATPWGVFASRGAWLDEQTLFIESDILQGSTTSTIHLRFHGTKVDLTVAGTSSAPQRLVGSAL